MFQSIMSKPAKKNFLFQELNTKSCKKYTFFWFAVVVAVVGMQVFKAFYGLGTPDESFYLTIPYRLFLGDVFFVNEWHVSQLSAVLQYPFVWLFLKITGSGEGLILYFRLLFILFQTIFSCFVFFTMRRYGFISAFLSSLLFELYYPEYTMSLDYYTLSLFAVLILSFLLFFSERCTRSILIVSGMLLAIAILAEPPLVFLYPLYFLFIFINRLHKKSDHPMLSLRSFGLLTLGIAIVFIAFSIFFFSRLSLAELLSALKNIFRSGEYSRETLFMGYPMFIKSLIRYYSWAAIASFLFPLIIIIDKKRQDRRLLWSFLSVIIAFACVITAVIRAATSGSPLPFVHLPYVLSFVGINSYILLQNKRKELLYVWLTGFLYVALVALTSVATDCSGAYGFVISSIASVPLTLNLFNELLKEIDGKIKKKRQTSVNKSRIAVNKIVFIAIALNVVVLAVYCYMGFSLDPAASSLGREPLVESVLVDQGGFKGIRILPQQKEVYDSVLNDVAYIENHTNGKYTVLSSNSWYLFSSDTPPLAFTLWYLRDFYTYIDYYKYVDESPSFIYIVNQSLYWEKAGKPINVEEELSFFTSRFDCEIIEGQAGFLLKVNDSVS